MHKGDDNSEGEINEKKPMDNIKEEDEDNYDENKPKKKVTFGTEEDNEDGKTVEVMLDDEKIYIKQEEFDKLEEIREEREEQRIDNEYERQKEKRIAKQNQAD